MEDFVREIDRGSALFILYGEAGVGKSRLLVKLKNDRLAHKSVQFIDFKADSQVVSSQQINDICDTAAESEVIIFDHFESASNKSQQQIFDNWSTDGRDKKLNFIICCSSAVFNRCRQLARQFQLEAMSFQLQPCEPEESEDYLRHLLYPDQPFATLVMPNPVRRLLRQSNGLFGRIMEVADHHGSEIEVKNLTESSSRTIPFVIVAGLFFAILAVGYLVYVTQTVNALENVELSKQVEAIPAKIPIEQEPEPQNESGSELLIAAEPVSVTKTDTPEILQTEPEKDRLQQRLDHSRDWIANSSAGRGTIQIMTVPVGRFNDDNFLAYLNKLHQQGLDTMQLRLFETRAGNTAVYKLIYGDFTDTREANRQIAFLPEFLAAEKPIPRSAGSIASEIARMSNV